MTIDLRVGDCLDIFGAESDASFDAFVSDWPAGVAFMGRAWDKAHGGRDAWVRAWAERAAMMRRKAKPGAYSLTWALPRTSHWTATALDDAGWVIQDVITHVFGQGWPKGRSALKPASEHWILARNGSGGALQIDAARVARGSGDVKPFGSPQRSSGGMLNGTGEARPQFEQHEGGSWPPNLMLSHCPECEERGAKSIKGAARTGPNGGAHQAGGITRGDMAGLPKGYVLGGNYTAPDGTESVPAFDCLAACDCGLSRLAPAGGEPPRCACGAGMWWACPVAKMDAQSGDRRSTLTGRADPSTSHAHPATARPANFFGQMSGGVGDVYADSGGASRFFPCFQYMAKSAGGERHAGCDDLYWRADKRSPFGFVRVSREEWERLPEDERARGNVHPTVKSIALMERLVALVTPPGGRLGDVTLGSGGTAIALHRLNVTRGLGATMLGCDICPETIEISEARLAWWRSVRHDTRPVKRQDEPGEPAQTSLLFTAVRT